MDKRQHPRFLARFHSSSSSVTVVTGEGDVVDLSLRGCCVESETSVHPGSILTMRVHMLQHEPPDHHRRSRRAVNTRGPFRY